MNLDGKINFIVYCIEEYKSEKNLTGKSLIDLFNQYDVIHYIQSCYEALHTTSSKYIINDIQLYIESRLS